MGRHFFPSLNWNLVLICKGWKIKHCKFTTCLLQYRSVWSYACCLVIHLGTYIWFWSFMLALNTLEEYRQQYFQKWGSGVKFWWWEFRWVGHQSGELEPCLLWGGGELIFRWGWYPSEPYVSPVATTRIGFWNWIWSTRHCGLGQEVACWFQCWKNSTGFVWPV